MSTAVPFRAGAVVLSDRKDRDMDRSTAPTQGTDTITQDPDDVFVTLAEPDDARMLQLVMDWATAPACKNLSARLLAAEVLRLTGMLDADGDTLAWLLIREGAVTDAWRNLHPSQRAVVPAELAAELDEMAEHRDDPADIPAVRELARLRAIEQRAAVIFNGLRVPAASLTAYERGRRDAAADIAQGGAQ